MKRKGLDFGNIDLIFKVTGQRMLKTALSALSPEWIDGLILIELAQMNQNVYWEIRFWCHRPHSQGQKRSKNVDKALSSSYLLKGLIDHGQT